LAERTSETSDVREEDPWRGGREATAAEVKAIFDRHPLTGPSQEHYQALPAFVRLPRFLLDKLTPRTRRGVLAAIGLGAVLVAGGIWLAVEAAQRAQRQEARATAAFRASEVRRLVADQSAQTAPVSASSGPALLRELEAAVGADARARVREGSLDGPIRRTVCRPGGALINAAERTDLFRCFAVTSSAVGVTLGHDFLVRVDATRGRAIWCHNNYPPGHPDTEDAISVPLGRACTGR
jgi:hypothetical protein